MTSTTTCQFSVPLRYDGTTPEQYVSSFQYAQSVCVTEYSASSTILTSFGFTYGEIVISFFLFLVIIGYIFLNIPKLKRTITEK